MESSYQIRKVYYKNYSKSFIIEYHLNLNIDELSITEKSTTNPIIVKEYKYKNSVYKIRDKDDWYHYKKKYFKSV